VSGNEHLILQIEHRQMIKDICDTKPEDQLPDPWQ